MTSHAVLYYTHFVSEVVKREINNLARELGPEYSLFAVGCCPEKSTLDELANESTQVRAYLREDLRTLPYANQLARVDWKTLRRNPDLAIMRFFQGNPNFDYYWIIEYDVRYTGSWKLLLAELAESHADLLCTYVTTFKQGQNWVHWASFSSPDENIEEENLLRGFFPFARMSKRLMRAIDERCRRGWAGHPEVLWPTIAQSVGASIEEIGGSSKQVPQSRFNKFYEATFTKSGLFLSTFGAWPSYSEKNNFSVSSPPDILWHPVKE